MSSHRHFILFAILLSISLYAAEVTIVGTAGPMITKELGGISLYSWIFTSYIVTSTLTMPLWGKFADLYGRKKSIAAALVIFGLGSVFCSLSENIGFLIFGRAIKGIGGGGLLPLPFILVADLYNIKERPKIQSIVSGTWSFATILGPFIGGALAENIGWRGIFWINLIPVIFALLVFQFFYKEKSKQNEEQTQLPVFSFVHSVTTILFFLLAIKFLEESHFKLSFLFLILFIANAIWFFKTEKTTQTPLVSQKLLSQKFFKYSCVSGLFFGMVLIGHVSFAHLLFQNILKMPALKSGLMFVPFTLFWFLGTIVSTRLMQKYNSKKLILFGGFVTICALFVFCLGLPNLSDSSILILMAFMGIGMSFHYPIVLITIQFTAPKESVGVATSLLAWIRNVGQALGTPLLGLILSSSYFYKTSAIQKQTLQSHMQMTDAMPLAFALKNIYIIMCIALGIGFFFLLKLPRQNRLRNSNQ